jgi:hypothetical protein
MRLKSIHENPNINVVDEAHNNDAEGDNHNNSSSAPPFSQNELKDNSMSLEGKSSFRPFYLHEWLDIRDTQESWLEGQIIAISNKQGNPTVANSTINLPPIPSYLNDDAELILIHYKGWKSKYDEWLSGSADHKDNERIQPLHTATHPPYPPYNGPIQVNLAVDVLDTTDKFLPAKIIAIDEQHCMVLISYLGWEGRYDEWLNSNSYRIKPANTYTSLNNTAGNLLHNSNNDKNLTVDSLGRIHPQSSYTATVDNESRFRQLLADRLGFDIVDQKEDGNCLFRSVAHQIYGNPNYHCVVREKCLKYIELERNFFSSYISEDFLSYINRMKQDGAWGDHVEIQAMSELYDRPVEIYAYSDKPMRTYQQQQMKNKYPIRLSYHFQSHYNSVVHRNSHHNHIIQSNPGEVEEQRIANRRTRDNNSTNSTQNSNKEEQELQLALSLSRQQFLRNDVHSFDAVVAGSIKDLDHIYESRIAAAQTASLREATDRLLLDETMKKSEEEELDRQLLQAAGVNSNNTNIPAQTNNNPNTKNQTTQSIEEQQLQRVLAESLALNNTSDINNHNNSMVDDDLKLAVDLSLAPPQPIQLCLDFGFSESECISAYSIFSADSSNPTVVAQAMIDYITQNHNRYS